ncbi:IS3 family transposase ISBce14 [Clostridium felsineum]|uniref:IS3 family transposase ISBce14 n=1 Tax=Clostridium felsineum TaxID=36839 RepID=A0A1S8LMV6_9CLOT|nr:IS3 family transposase ISBce14 [Clostridium felsineum]URZ11646.1 IS3 family transposase ISBce14 [Clostridium felsineum]
MYPIGYFCYNKTNEEIEILSKNKYVKHVSAKGITYTEEFKRIFISENENGKLPRIIFEECGFSISILGKKRMQSSADRWRLAYRTQRVLGLQDTRKQNSGRSSEKELSIEEKYERIKAQNNLLKAENELLKKLDMLERRRIKKISLPVENKFNIINLVVTKYKLKNMISYLCKIAAISRSGYYNYFSSKSQGRRKERNNKAEITRDIILKAYNFKGRKKGARQIKVTLEGQF